MEEFFQDARAQKRGFDLIVSNPPYIPEDALAALPDNVRREPRAALNGGADGLRFYRMILRGARDLVHPAGILALEMGDGQRQALLDLFSRFFCYTNVEFYRDYVGTDRVVTCQFKG